MALPALEALVADPTVTTGRAPWVSLPAPDLGIQRLAIGILKQGLNDLADCLHDGTSGGNVAADPENADTAVAFLGDADMLDVHCQLAGTTAMAVQREACWRLRKILCTVLRRELVRRLKSAC